MTIQISNPVHIMTANDKIRIVLCQCSPKKKSKKRKFKLQKIENGKKRENKKIKKCINR